MCKKSVNYIIGYKNYFANLNSRNWQRVAITHSFWEITVTVNSGSWCTEVKWMLKPCKL